VLGKSNKTNLEEVKALENEFKCYLRPVIEQGDHNGWSFLADNLKLGSTALYPKIY
jgi:hypothetical protein